MLAVAGLALFRWKEIEEYYYLTRFRREPTLIESLGKVDVSTSQGRAARAFLRETAGAVAVVRWFLQDLDLESDSWIGESSAWDDPPAGQDEKIRYAKQALLGHVQSERSRWHLDHHFMVVDWAWGSGSRSRLSPMPVQTNCACDFLKEIEGIEIELPEFPGLRLKSIPPQKGVEFLSSSSNQDRRGRLGAIKTVGQHLVLVYKHGKPKKFR